MKDLIKLNNVSKFYYNKGVIASGFSKLNVSFNIGEFVAITGESGSGKSTLLNVISGLDTYEEGEMYINGEETSHYTDIDFENYRRKYVSNIFQTFNLVNSYTVYQNVELVLLINGYDKKEIRDKVLNLIDIVGLTKWKNSKVSKLSGGQKQRVAIARALAKETPIIIADEPTGNLDSKAAKDIIKLLSEIAKDKLVIVVTHNYDQVEEYVTRKIKMHDGKIIEDKKVKEYKREEYISTSDFSSMTLSNRIRIGVRNTFNVIPKCLLILFIFAFISMSLLSEYSSMKEDEYLTSQNGTNYYFNDVSIERIVIKKKDKSSFSENDYNKIAALSNVETIVKNDLFLDTDINFTTDNGMFWMPAHIKNIKDFKGEINAGRISNNDNEIIIEGNENDYYLGYGLDEILDKDFLMEDFNTGNIDREHKYKLVGVSYNKALGYSNYTIYLNENLIEKLSSSMNQKYSNFKVYFEGKYRSQDYYNSLVVPSKSVPKGSAYISSDLSGECENFNCSGHNIKVFVENMYFNEMLDLTVSEVYNKNNFEALTGVKDYEGNNGRIYVNEEEYNNIFDKDPYQSSVYVKNVDKIENTVKELNSMGIDTLMIKDTLIKDNISAFLRILRTVVTVISVVVLFFISYFVIKIILKSRNVYFATLRMLGANKNTAKELLIIELLNAASISYLIVLIAIYLASQGIINVSSMNTMVMYLELKDYIVLYALLLLISYLISLRFAKKLFKNSAITTIHEEV